MNTTTLPQVFARTSPQKPAQQSLAPRGTWLDRLAAWAERQPQHRRLVSWNAL